MYSENEIKSSKVIKFRYMWLWIWEFTVPDKSLDTPYHLKFKVEFIILFIATFLYSPKQPAL